MTATGLEVREAGRALRVQTETPHLVSMGSGRLSTAVTLHPLPEGKVVLGSKGDADISVSGTGVEGIHCAIENENGVVTLYPISGITAVDGTTINSPVKLVQGCMLSIGRSNYLRFNNPAEAKRLRSVLPHSRISMVPITFSPAEASSDQCSQDNTRHLERKPPVVPRKSPRNSYSDDEGGFLGKLTKFEMLSRQNRGNCVSPKVFPAGSLTANVPADQILGHSRSASLVSLGNNNNNNNRNSSSSSSSSSSNQNNNNNNNSPLQNLTNIDRNRSTVPSVVSPSSLLAQRIDEDRHSTTSDSKTSSEANKANLLHCRTHSSAESFYTENNNENSPEWAGFVWPKNGGDLMSRSDLCQRTYDIDSLSTREYDMSQSLIVGRSPGEYPRVEKFSSNTIGRSSCKRIHPPSPAFNREPKYNDQWRFEARIESPTLSVGSSSCSVDELRERLQSGAEDKRKRAQEERMREQELEKQEKIRLEEILVMCAEYERQSKVDKPRKPIGIKTNGSLPRDKRLGQASSSFDDLKSPARNNVCFSNEMMKRMSSNSVSYENASVENSFITISNNEEIIDRCTEDFGEKTECQNRSLSISSLSGNESLKRENTYGTAERILPNRTMQHDVTNYENVTIDNAHSLGSYNGNDAYTKSEKADDSRKKKTEASRSNSMKAGRSADAFLEQEKLNFSNDSIGLYENVPTHTALWNNDRNQSISKKKSRTASKSHDMIDNKLAISNDDLLEAIEQLSMLSKSSRDIRASPKRNNVEKDNAKSNETKANKEKKELERQGKKKYIEFLQNEKLHVLGNMDALKRSIADIEIQEEEISRELELEKALLSAEYESESLKLSQDEEEKLKVQMGINKLEREMAENNAIQVNLQSEAKQRVQKAQRLCCLLEDELKNSTEETKRQVISAKLLTQQDILETERKAFEDLEFRHLEEEASKLATREELQRYLSELTTKIEARKSQLNLLESQRTDAKNAASKDAKILERQKLNHLKKLEEARNRLRRISNELGTLAQNPTENFGEKRSPSREDFDRISRVTNDSPIVNDRGSLGRKTIESLKEIERNRQLHLAKQGSQVISEERRRVEELKKRVQNEVRSQWEERKMNCVSFNSIESGEESSSYSAGLTESGSGSSDGAEGVNSEKLSATKLSELTSPTPGPSNNSNGLARNDNLRDTARTSIGGERLSNDSGGVDENESRPLSQTSSEMDSLGPIHPVKHREKAKLQRPLTRYLPIKSESLDLRHHIETAGHQLPLIYDVTVDGTCCSGYLSKMSKKFHHWNKRWFVFDRKKKTLCYYSDNISRKARGIIYFQSIEEVYVDHMNTVKSPQPSLTFIVKTTSRLYHLMAPSPEAMRVWVDVIFTGAEGYHEFDHGV